MHASPSPGSSRAPLKIAGIYMGLAILWIAFSDHGVSLLFDDPAVITLAQTVKGWFFVFATALLIFFLLRREIGTYQTAMDHLRRSGQELRDILDAMPVGIALTDGTNIEYINTDFSQRFGYSPDEIPTDQQWFLLAYPDPGYRESLVTAWQADLQRARTHGTPIPPYEVRITCKNGQICQVIANTQLIGSRVLVIMTDITERELLRNELTKIQKLESIGVLAGGIAHDFNNILTGIMGNISYAQLLLAPAGSARPSLDAAMKGVERAAELTRQLLTFARGGQPVKKVVAVQQLLGESLTLMLRGTRVKGELTVEEPVPAVKADEGQLSQVFTNIIINAVQAMPEGGILRAAIAARRLEGGNTLALAEGDYVRITVSDTGCGMPPETLARIFDPYFSTKASGNGLGLASAYSIVIRHGGSISAESEQGRGSTFILHLPATDERPSETAPAAQGTVSMPEHRDERQVLVMDDEEAICDIAETMLTHLGYEVQACRDGAAAIDLYRQALDAGVPYAAVIMDLTIPGGMGGIEAAARILKLHPEAHLVVSSGYFHDPIMSDYTRYGFCAVLAKPYRITDMQRVLDEILATPGPAAVAPCA